MNWFMEASRICDKALHKEISDGDLDAVIGWPLEELPILMAAADRVRSNFFGNRVKVCSLMNIKSGGCSEDCGFCAQSAHNPTDVPVYGLSSPEDIREKYRYFKEHKLDFCVVASGRGMAAQDVRTIAAAIKTCGGPLHASLGIIGDKELEMLRDAGVVCYNHNLETGRTYFKNIVGTHSYDERIETVKRAKKTGLKVCCGGIFGMGESWQDRKELALELKSLDVDIIPINFLIPVKGIKITAQSESPREYLKIISFFRFVLPDKVIKVCGGREVNLRSLQAMIFFAGANGFISGGYLTTGGSGVEADNQMMRDLDLRCYT